MALYSHHSFQATAISPSLALGTLSHPPAGLKLNLQTDLLASLLAPREAYLMPKAPPELKICSGLTNSKTSGSALTFTLQAAGDPRPPGTCPDYIRPGTSDYPYLLKSPSALSELLTDPWLFDDVKRVVGSVALKWARKVKKLRIIAWVDTIGELAISAETRAELQAANRAICPGQIKDRGSLLVFIGVTKQAQKQQIFVSLGSLKVMDASGKQYFKFDSFDVEGVSPQEMAIMIKHSLPYFSKIAYSHTILLNCPDPDTAFKMKQKLDNLRQNGDTVGGSVGCAIFGLQSGLAGAVDAQMASVMFQLNDVKSFEIGGGLPLCALKGSESIDRLQPVQQAKSEVAAELPKMKPRSNNQGGVTAGILTGQPFCFRVGFRAPAGRGKKQEVVGIDGKWRTVQPDINYAPASVHGKLGLVEGMAALVILGLLKPPAQ